jgi:hypothetical protein
MAEIQETNGYLDVENATLRSSKIEATSNIGIANTAPQHAFSVGSNLYIDTESSNVLTVDGNVVCEGVKVGLIEIVPSYDLAAVSNVGNVTQSTIQFSNATTGFVTTANIEVGTANLFVDTTTGKVGIGKTDPGSALDVVGDVEISSNLAVSGSKFTYNNTNTTVFTGTATAVTNEIGYLDMSTSSRGNNTYVKIYIKFGQGGGIGEAEYSFYIRPDGANASLIYDYRNRGGTITPVVYRTDANDLWSDGTPGVVRFGYSIDSAQSVIWRVEVIQRSGNATFYPTNTGSAVDTTGLVQVTPAPFTSFDSNVAVNTDDLFVDTVNSRVGIGTTSPAYSLDVNGTSRLPNIVSTDYSKQFTQTYSVNFAGITATDEELSLFQFEPDISTFTIIQGEVSVDILSRRAQTYMHFQSQKIKIKFNFSWDARGNTGSWLVSNIFVDRVKSIGPGGQIIEYPVEVRYKYKGDRSPDLNIPPKVQVYLRYNGSNFLGRFNVNGVYHSDELDYGLSFPSTIFTSDGNTTDTSVDTLMAHDMEYGTVGIGTASPDDILHLYNATDSTLRVETDTGQAQLLLRSGASTRRACRIDFSRADTGTQYMQLIGDYQQNGLDDFTVASSTSGRIMTWLQNGNVGIGMTTPSYKLQVLGNTLFQGLHNFYSQIAPPSYGGNITDHSQKAIQIGNQGTETNSDWGILQNGDNHLYFYYGLFSRGYMNSGTNVGSIDFTGQHRNFIDGVSYANYGSLEGLIVSANKNKYYDIDENVTTGANAIQISQSLPLVALSTTEKDKACFGVISGVEDPDTRTYEQGTFVTVLQKQRGDRRAFINSLGEGAIWVTNINGSLESGDYITTSNVVGYGQKQDSEFLANYTVAKITMDCDFEPATQPIQIIRKEMGDVNYWVKTTYENISEEEYSNLTEESRRTITETVYTNEDGKIFPEQNEQSTYTELEQTTYQKITVEESETEQEGWELTVRQELVNVLDEHGQIQWEDDPSGATEKAYKIRYLDADGNITDEANHVYKAAFVGCTYHCG